jgi:hypothetical protein
MKMEKIECSETLAYKIQMPGNYSEENIQHTEHGESLKSRKLLLFLELQFMTYIKQWSNLVIGLISVTLETLHCILSSTLGCI